MKRTRLAPGGACSGGGAARNMERERQWMTTAASSVPPTTTMTSCASRYRHPRGGRSLDESCKSVGTAHGVLVMAMPFSDEPPSDTGAPHAVPTRLTV
jgi:hypothetical protein